MPLHDVTIDPDRFRLARFLDTLRAAGELSAEEAPFKLSEVARRLEGDRKSVLFEQAGPARQRLAGNVMGSRARMALAFGTDPAGLAAEVLRRLRGKAQIHEIAREAAPVQEVVLTGADVDLTQLPVHFQHRRDAGPYISASIDFTRHPQTGFTNIGLRRLLLRGRTETGIDLTAPSDLRATYQASAARGEKLPISFVVGAHPADYLAGTMRVPGDELELLASLRDAPLAVVKSITSDIRVPADAEYVIEGYLDPRGYIEPEGPYGEVLGYYGGVKANPVFHATAITRRRDAIFQTVTISGRTLGRTDSAQLITLRTEVLIWRVLETAIREPVAVYAPPATGGSFTVRVAMRQRVPGEARNAIAAILGSLANVKHVFVVDPDIDIFSDEQMEWALATRFQPDRDLVVERGLRTSGLDPSLHGARTSAKSGFDLTLPLGTSGIETNIPEAPRYDGTRFPSLDDALADGPKHFEELMAAIGSEDGREIVLALDTLRNAGRLRQDIEDGRYRLVGEPTP